MQHRFSETKKDGRSVFIQMDCGIIKTPCVAAVSYYCTSSSCSTIKMEMNHLVLELLCILSYFSLTLINFSNPP